MGDSVDARIEQLGITLPPPVAAPDGVTLPFATIRILGKRVLLAGHGPQTSDGKLTPHLGQVGSDLTVEQGADAARLVAYSMLGTLQRELGTLDEIGSWVKVLGMVNAAPGFTRHVEVINGFSLTILELFGPERGTPVRSAVGMGSLPFNMPVEVEAELALR